MAKAGGLLDRRRRSRPCTCARHALVHATRSGNHAPAIPLQRVRHAIFPLSIRPPTNTQQQLHRRLTLSLSPAPCVRCDKTWKNTPEFEFCGLRHDHTPTTPQTVPSTPTHPRIVSSCVQRNGPIPTKSVHFLGLGVDRWPTPDNTPVVVATLTITCSTIG